MITVVLKAITLTWIVIGSVLSYRVLRGLFDPDLQPARNAWRRQEFGDREAQRRAAYFTTNLAFLRVFTAVMLGWPVFTWSVLHSRWRESNKRLHEPE
jgi:hypothetical protein